MRYSESFYLDLLGFLKNKFPTFYWGENDEGYYWGDSGLNIYFEWFNDVQELVDSVSNYLHLR